MAAGDERRAIGRRNEQARRQIGLDNEAARRSSGRQMEAARRGVDVVEDIARLTPPQAPRRQLSGVPAIGGYAPQRGRADYNPPRSQGGGGGVDSPLTEVPDSRVYGSEAIYVETIDGSGLFRVKAASKLTLRDAVDREVVINLDATP